MYPYGVQCSVTGMYVNELLVYRTLDAQRAWIFESNVFEKMETLLYGPLRTGQTKR